MRKLVWLSITVVALVASGVAIAHGFDSKSVKAVSGTFTATTASNVRTSTCTGTNNDTYVSSSGSYAGTASGDPTLSGPVTINASSLIDTTTNVGQVNGQIRIGSGSTQAAAQFTAVYSGGTLAGFTIGRISNPDATLYANVSAGFSATGGFTSGLIGGGTAAGSAIEVSSGSCQVVQPPKPDRIAVDGAVTAVSSTSISAAGVTCSVPANLQSAVANVKVGDRVELRCEVTNGQTTLDSVNADQQHYNSDNHGGRKHH